MRVDTDHALVVEPVVEEALAPPGFPSEHLDGDALIALYAKARAKRAGAEGA